MLKTIIIFCLTFWIQAAQGKDLYVKDGEATNNIYQSSKVIDQITGVYKRRSVTNEVVGQDSPLEDILEIVKVDDDTIYFRTRLNSYTGNICGLHGTAVHTKNDLFLYEDKSEPECKLAIKVTEKGIKFIDGYEGSDQCSNSYCGHNANLNGASFAKSIRRPIKYIDRLKNSTQYKESIAELNKK